MSIGLDFQVDLVDTMYMSKQANTKEQTTTSKLMYFASELRYIGRGTVEKAEPDGNLIVNIPGVGRGRVAADMVFKTKREALNFAQVPQSGGWSDVAKLNLVGRR